MLPTILVVLLLQQFVALQHALQTLLHSVQTLLLLSLQSENPLAKHLLRLRLRALAVVPSDLVLLQTLHRRKHAVAVVYCTLIGVLLLV